MSVVVQALYRTEIPPTLVRLRAHAATARTLLDELERAVPSPGAVDRTELEGSLAEQLAKELARLGCRMLECAALVSLVTSDLGRGRA